MAIAALSTAVMSYAVKFGLDSVLTPKSTPHDIYSFAALILGVFIAKGLSSYGETITLSWIMNNVIFDLQSHMFEKLIFSNPLLLKERSTGDLTQRLIGELSTLRTLLTQACRVVGKDSLTLLFLLALIFYYDVYLSLICFVGIPLIAVPVRIILSRIKKSATFIQDKQSLLSGCVTEVLRHIQIVQSFVGEHFEIIRFKKQASSLRAAQNKMVYVGELIVPLTELSAGLIIAGIITYGALSISAGMKTVGSFFAFIVSLLLAYEPLKRIMQFLTAQYQMIQVSFERIDDILHLPSHAFKDVDVPLIDGKIELRGVSVKYGHETILKDVSFILEKGQKIAFIGPSGSGKTTILNLLLGFVAPSKGLILIDDKQISRFDIHGLRKKIALISQEPALFNMSVYDNVAYGLGNITDEKVVSALKSAHAWTFVSSLKDGLHTIIQESGANFSGGQKQRLTIARALLKDASVYLLDEITSALDDKTRASIDKTIADICEDKTMLIVSHRTVPYADRVFEVKDGSVTEL